MYIYDESLPAPLVHLPGSWNEAWQEAGGWMEEMVEADGEGVGGRV